MNVRLPETVLSTVILTPEVPVRYTLTYEVSDPGGVAGINDASAQILVLGVTSGDGIASANGAFLVPERLFSSSAIPVFDAT